MYLSPRETQMADPASLRRACLQVALAGIFFKAHPPSAVLSSRGNGGNALRWRKNWSWLVYSRKLW